ncbi:MAG TPA: hypothetical protein VFU21_06805 [Kofleriaceae bacterium]|nr:hypothetical protein [Kofleriaceae bacterium]
MKFAAAAVILVLSAPVAAAGPKTKVAAKSKTAAKPATAAPAPSPEPAFGTSRLRHETIGIGPGYGSIEAGQAELARKDDDVALNRSLAARGAAPQAAGPFAAVEAAVAKKKPTATGRVRVSFDVDRRGKVQRAIVVGFDRGVDKAIEAQLAAIVLPREYAGQHVDTVLAFRQGKLLRR